MKFIKDNHERAHMVFYKKMIYNGVLEEHREYVGKNLVDFDFVEKILYGKVNQNYTPITILKSSLKTASPSYSATSNKSSTQRAINFVMDEFTQMAIQFEKAVATGKISSNEKYLSNLKIYKSYQDPHLKYSEYFDVYSNSIVKSMQEDINLFPFVTFQQFVDRLFPRLQKSLRSFPFTKTGFVKSGYCSQLSSGLALEIADLSYSDDQSKINHFINSKNWNYFVKTCSSYGFIIDQDIPWRIVADIGNPEFLRLYGRPYRVVGSNPGTIFNRLYSLTHERYYKSFKFQLLNLYNLARLGMVRKESFCNINGSVSTYELSSEYDPFGFEEAFPEEYFLEIYFKMRFLEEEAKFTSYEQETLIADLLSFYKPGGTKVAGGNNLNRCLYYFEFIINKTFDYRGSASYINKAIKARQEYEEERMLENRQQQYQESNLLAGGYQSKKIDGVDSGPLPVDDIGDTIRRNPFEKFNRKASNDFSSS